MSLTIPAPRTGQIYLNAPESNTVRRRRGMVLVTGPTWHRVTTVGGQDEVAYTAAVSQVHRSNLCLAEAILTCAKRLPDRKMGVLRLDEKH